LLFLALARLRSVEKRVTALEETNAELLRVLESVAKDNQAYWEGYEAAELKLRRTHVA
jgi:hypothetical protein